MGLSAVDQNGTYSVHGDIQMQKGLAALVMAGLSVIIFFTSRLVLCLRWSWLITTVAALGTQIWSTASRALWSQTWGILVLGFAIWLVVRADVKKAALRPVLLGTCLSWLYFIRPTFGISIAVITLYVLIYQRQSLLTLVLTGCLWLAGFIGFSEYHFGQRLPLYYHSYDTRMASLFWQRLAGTLISPSRGLIIYVPITLFLGYLLVQYRSTSRLRLVVTGVGVVLLHVLLLSMYLGWHGGFCYGPRLTTDIVPWLALLGILGVEARLKWRVQNSAHDSALRIGTEWACATVLLLCSITLNALGAISLDTQRWNAVPKNIDEFQNRLWDWKHPQFLGVPRDSPTRHIKDFTPHA